MWDNQQWYETRKTKYIRKEKNASLEVEAYFHISERLARLGWNSMLRLLKYIYPDLVRKFYANLVDKDKYSGNFIESYVRCRHLALSCVTITEVLGCWNEGQDIKLRKGFYTSSSKNITQVHDRFKVRFGRLRIVEKLQLSPTSFHLYITCYFISLGAISSIREVGKMK